VKDLSWVETERNSDMVTHYTTLMMHLLENHSTMDVYNNIEQKELAAKISELEEKLESELKEG
jgi:hypothetical protein